jgi:hypothetical protein
MSGHRTTSRIFTRTTRDDMAIFGLDPVDLIAGELSRRQRRLVEA